jgi:hypothetical protein
MKIVVTHNSPDWDAITSVWLIKRFLPGWEDAEVKFVPAGQRLANSQLITDNNPIEKIKDDEVIHVDTGLGPLDHHQTSSDKVCGASLSWDYVKISNDQLRHTNEKMKERIEAIDRIVKVVVDIDHFKEVFWPDASADYHEFSLFGLLEGLKIKNPDQDSLYVEKGMEWLDCIVHNFENRIWAEKEMKEKGQEFATRFGKALAVETINDSFLKLAQKMGYVIVVRKDSRKGYVRIKARPANEKGDIDLTLVYEQLQKMDPKATWFLHVSKKMLLNGTPKNPKMIPSTLTLQEIVNVVKKI